MNQKIFNVGDRVVVTRLDVGDVRLFPLGAKGEIVYSSGLSIFVLFDEGQGVDSIGNSAYHALTGKFCTNVWRLYNDQLEHEEPNAAFKYKPGDKGWVPDKLKPGIDISKVTADLVTVLVGK